jgi:predicted transcriptional regulator
MIPSGHAARISLIGISILRYLVLKSQPVSITQIHLEWCFCNSFENWDLNEKDFRFIVQGLKSNRLCEEYTTPENKRLYTISPNGIQLLQEFIQIDTNIVNQEWK